jgi:uncharacterized ferritin-like protein (DUF455 family)
VFAAAAAAATGVVWFGRLCAAMGLAPPDAFRAWLAVLGPELLKGPFNHEERQQVRYRAGQSLLEPASSHV